MKIHPVYAYNMLDSIDYLKPAIDNRTVTMKDGMETAIHSD